MSLDSKEVKSEDRGQNISPNEITDKLPLVSGGGEIGGEKEPEIAKTVEKNVDIQGEGDMLRERIEASEQKSPKGQKSPKAQRHRKTNISPEEQKALNHIRLDFQKSLAKLSENNTKEIGFKECQIMMKEYNSTQMLRIYLSLLGEQYKRANTAHKEMQVLLFGYLSEIYGSNLCDPLDKEPSLVKTIIRVCEMIHKYLQENSTIVHHACAHSLLQIYQNCMSKDSTQTICLIFYEPLACVIIGGADKMAKMAASHCILQFILAHFDPKQAPAPLLEYIFPKFLNIFIRSKCDCADFITCLTILIESCGVKYIVNNLNDIFKKLIKVLNSNSTYTYSSKIEVCKVLQLIATKLHDVADIIIAYYYNDVITGLELACKDRVLKVQRAALEAKKQWLILEKIYEQMEDKKTKQDLKECSPEDIIKQRTGFSNIQDYKLADRPKTGIGRSNKFSILRELSKLNKNEQKKLEGKRSYKKTRRELSPLEKQLLETEEQRDKLMESLSKWSNASRGQKFLKKGMGTGGGFSGELETRGRRGNQSYDEHRELLRNAIKEQLEKGAPGDKWQLLDQGERGERDLSAPSQSHLREASPIDLEMDKRAKERALEVHAPGTAVSDDRLFEEEENARGTEAMPGVDSPMLPQRPGGLGGAHERPIKGRGNKPLQYEVEGADLLEEEEGYPQPTPSTQLAPKPQPPHKLSSQGPPTVENHLEKMTSPNECVPGGGKVEEEGKGRDPDERAIKGRGNKPVEYEVEDVDLLEEDEGYPQPTPAIQLPPNKHNSNPSEERLYKAPPERATEKALPRPIERPREGAEVKEKRRDERPIKPGKVFSGLEMGEVLDEELEEGYNIDNMNNKNNMNNMNNMNSIDNMNNMEKAAVLGREAPKKDKYEEERGIRPMGNKPIVYETEDIDILEDEEMERREKIESDIQPKSVERPKEAIIRRDAEERPIKGMGNTPVQYETEDVELLQDEYDHTQTPLTNPYPPSSQKNFPHERPIRGGKGLAEVRESEEFAEADSKKGITEERSIGKGKGMDWRKYDEDNPDLEMDNEEERSSPTERPPRRQKQQAAPPRHILAKRENKNNQNRTREDDIANPFADNLKDSMDREKWEKLKEGGSTHEINRPSAHEVNRPSAHEVNRPQTGKNVDVRTEGSLANTMSDMKSLFEKGFANLEGKMCSMEERISLANSNIQYMKNTKDLQDIPSQPVTYTQQEDYALTTPKQPYLNSPNYQNPLPNPTSKEELGASAQNIPRPVQPYSDSTRKSRINPPVDPGSLPPPNDYKDFGVQEDLEEEGNNTFRMDLDPLTSMWVQVLEDIKHENYESAFQKVIQSQDDLYLLRLMVETGPVLSKLKKETGLFVLQRLNQIIRSNILQNIAVNWIQATIENGLFMKQNRQSKNEILDTLYEFSALQNDVGANSAQIYTYITQVLTKQKLPTLNINQ